MSVFVLVVIGVFVVFCLLLAFALAKIASRSDAGEERLFRDSAEKKD